MVYSKNNKLDSLYKELSQNTEDIAALCNQISDEYFHLSPDSVIKYSNIAYKEALKAGNLKEQAKALNKLGLIEMNSSFFQSAINYFLEAIKTAKSIKDTILVANLYNNIAVAYINLVDLENAEKYLKMSLERKEPSEQGNILNNLGLIHHEQEEYTVALEYYLEAEQSYQLESNELGIATTQVNIGRLHRDQGEYKQSLKLFNKALKSFVKEGYIGNQATVLMNIGLSHLSSKSPDSALYYFYKSKELASRDNYPDILKKAFFCLSLAYEEKGDYDQATGNFREYHELHDSLFKVSREKQISDLNVKYETARKNQEIELLRKNNDLKQERMVLQNKWIIGLLSVISAILILTIIVFLMKLRLIISDRNLVEKNIELAKTERSIKEIRATKSVQEETVQPLSHDIKYVQSGLSEELKKKLYDRIIYSMENEKLFLEGDLTINKLAEHLDLSRTYLSQVINEKFNKNFNTLINEYRIIEAQDMLIDNKNYTIEGIAKEVGFRSKSSFNAAFKRHTGVTPSFYIKNTISNGK